MHSTAFRRLAGDVVDLDRTTLLDRRGYPEGARGRPLDPDRLGTRYLTVVVTTWVTVRVAGFPLTQPLLSVAVTVTTCGLQSTAGV